MNANLTLRSSSFTLVVLILAGSIGCSKSPREYLDSGKKYFQSGKYREATIQFQNAVHLDPKLAEGHYQLARAYLALKSPQAALQELKETVSLDSKNSDAELQLAALLIARRQYSEAKVLITKALAMEPKSSPAHALLGGQSALTGDAPGAIREFQTAIRLDPSQVQNYAALATVYKGAGQDADAEAVLRQAIEANPKSLQARLNAGSFYFSERNFAQTEAEVRAAAELNPRDPLPQLLLANCYVAMERFSEAEGLYARVKTIAPNDPSAYRALGSFYRSTGQREKAAAEFRSLLASKPKDDWVKANLTESLLEVNQVKEATVLSQELLKADPGNGEALLLRGRILIKEHNYQAAANALEAAVKAAPQSASAFYFLGVAQQALGFALQARGSFARAHDLSPAASAPELALAQLDLRKGDYAPAMRMAEKNPEMPLADVLGAQAALAQGNARQGEQLLLAALEQDPTSLPGLETLVRLYASQGKAQQAVDRISALIRQHPNNAGLHFLLAVGFFSLKDLQNSEANVRRAIALDAKTPDAHALLGEIHSAQGALSQAIGDLKAEIEVNPRKVQTYIVLADLYKKEGKWEEATKVSERALGVDPDSPLVANNLGYLYLEHGGDANMALTLARKAKQAMPESPSVTDTLGWAFYRTGSPKLAVEQLDFSVQKIPDNPVFQYHLGMAYLADGNYRSAAMRLQEALKLNPKFAYAGTARNAIDTIPKRFMK